MKINNDDLGLGTHHINNNMKVNNDDLGLRTKHINNIMKITNDDLGVGTLSMDRSLFYIRYPYVLGNIFSCS